MTEIKQEFKRKVSEKQRGTRLDHYLYISGIGLSRSLIQKLIKQGKVLVNNKPAKCAYRIKEGDEIYASFELRTSPELKPENIPLDIIYEDEDIIVINKQKGIIVHPARGHFEHTMVNALLYHCGRLPTLTDEIRPGVLHRLDKDTTGLIIFAKTDQALSTLGKAISRREVMKKYDVLCWGSPGLKEGSIEAPIGRSTLMRTKMTVTPLGSKMAITRYLTLERFPIASYLKVWLITGRTHQIRVHLNYIGCPVIGDREYGGRHHGVIRDARYLTHFQEILKLIDRQALHASELIFKHPRTNKELHFTAPLPEDMNKVMEYLRRVFPK